jgi:hypothetical protein
VYLRVFLQCVYCGGGCYRSSFLYHLGRGEGEGACKDTEKEKKRGEINYNGEEK